MLLVGGGIITLTSGQHVSANSRAVIDFETLLNVPIELHQPISDAVNSIALENLPDSNLAVSTINHSPDWMYAILVASHAIDTHWEEVSDKDFVEILAHRQADGRWISFVKGTQGFVELAQTVPPSWMDFSYLTKDTLAQPSAVNLTQSVEYLFPWTIGQKWFQVQGWHQGDHLDFQPVVRTNPATHFAVLAAAEGTMSLVCGGSGTLDPYQAHIRISHPDGNSTYYLHLDANTIRYDLIGKSIPRGQFIGLLYNGVQGSGNGYQYSTNCGYGQAVHLHFGAPRTITINGYDINTVASVAFATQYGSSNTRIDDVQLPINMAIDAPPDGVVVQGQVGVSGWALHQAAPSGTGVDQVHLYLDGPAGQGQGIAPMTYGTERADVAAAYGERYRYSGYQFTWDTMNVQPGVHTLYVHVHSIVSGWSFFTRTITVVHPSIPAIPTGFQVSTTNQDTITLVWQNNASNADGYRIYRWNGTDWPLYATLGATATSFTDTTLLCNQGYSYRLAVFNSTGEILVDGWIDGFTTACPSPPSAPTDFQVIPSTQSSLTLSWQDTANDETGFNIYKWSYNGSTWDFYYLTSVGANTITFTDSNLACHAEYFYQVSGYNAIGESVRTAWMSATTGTCPPNPPTNLRVDSTTPSGIGLVWQDNSTDELGFHVYKWINWFGWDFYYLGTVNTDVTTFWDPFLTCDTKYYYQVSAYNAAGVSSRTMWITGTTGACDVTQTTTPVTAPTSTVLPPTSVSTDIPIMPTATVLPPIQTTTPVTAPTSTVLPPTSVSTDIPIMPTATVLPPIQTTTVPTNTVVPRLPEHKVFLPFVRP